MRRTRSIVLELLAVTAIFAIAGCDAGPGPSAPAATPSASSARLDPSERPDPSVVVGNQLAGPWRSSPIVLDEAHVAIVSDACAAKARENLDETAANLPTALVDARGERLVTVIMADDLNAIVCLAHLANIGMSATVDSVDRLAMTPVAPVDKSRITVASVILDEGADGRTVAFGRIGPDADAAKAGFGDNSTVLGSKDNGWWAMWWPGVVRANSYAATDTHDLVVGSAKPPAGEVEARVGPASWWLDPAARPPTPTSTTIRALVKSRRCSSGQTPEGRIEPPTIDLSDVAVTISYEIRFRAGTQECPGTPPFSITITLPEPLGNRSLFDGSETPPRDAAKPPSG